MFTNKDIKLGICPIGWTNDDMWDLGDENTFQQCISEMRLGGFTGWIRRSETKNDNRK